VTVGGEPRNRPGDYQYSRSRFAVLNRKKPAKQSAYMLNVAALQKFTRPMKYFRPRGWVKVDRA
jgi:hypothetical protein